MIESALEGVLDDHLGYAKHDLVGGNDGDSGNRRRGKTVRTDKHPLQHRSVVVEMVPGVEELVISLPGADHWEDLRALGRGIPLVLGVTTSGIRDDTRLVVDGEPA